MRFPLALPADRPIDVVGVGQNTTDHLCVVDEPPATDGKQRLRAYEVQPGGQVATALVALSRWGARTAYVGAFGDDPAGRSARAALEADGVDCTGAVDRADTPNQLSVVLVDGRTGARSVLWHRAPSLPLAPEEVPADLLVAGRILHLDGLDGPAAVAAARTAREAGVVVTGDVDTLGRETGKLLPLVDVLLVPWEFARAYTREDRPEAALDRLARGGHAVAGITLGAGGAMVCVGEQLLRVPGHDVRAVDTTGAGDVFHAAFLHGMLDGLDVEATLRLANAAAALQCSRLGGRAAIPSLLQARALARSCAS